jgi:UDP-N-acetyl-2-amino-2-deoxyglucuronate dehydrogenase
MTGNPGARRVRTPELGIGIVGCGAVSGVHAEAISKAEGAALTSVYSRTPEKAEALGRRFGVPGFADWDSFIRDGRLQAVSICTPNGTHLDYARLAAEAGKHVIVEKPIETTAARGKALIDACRRNRVRLAVVFQNRFLPGVAAMKRTIDSGTLGKVFLVDISVKWFRDRAYYAGAAWRGTFALDGGGVLINQAIHTLDLAQVLAGPIRSVFGQTGTFTHPGVEGEDTAVAALRFESGALGSLAASTSVNPPEDRRIAVHGENGTAVLSGDSFFRPGEGNARPESTPGGGKASPLADFSSEPHRMQFEAVVRAICRGEEPPVSGEEALRSLAVVLSIYESARTGRPVDVDDFIKNNPNGT